VSLRSPSVLAWCGVWGFFVGGVGMVITLALAGILNLTVRDHLRWGLTWIAFSFWIYLNTIARQPVLGT